MWRGKGNLRGIKGHGVKLNELPSIILPLYYLFLPIAFVLLFYMYGILLSIAMSLALLFAPALLIAIHVSCRMSEYNYVFKAFVVYLVYFIARAVALVL